MNCCPPGLWSLAGHDGSWHLTPGDSEPWRSRDLETSSRHAAWGRAGTILGSPPWHFIVEASERGVKRNVSFPISISSSCGIWCYLYQRHLPIVTAVRFLSRDSGYIYQAQTQSQITRILAAEITLFSCIKYGSISSEKFCLNNAEPYWLFHHQCCPVCQRASLHCAWRWSLPLMFMQIRPKLPKLYPNSVKPPTTVNSEATTITSLQIFAKIFPNIFVCARTMVCPGANIFVPDKILLMNNCQIKVTRPIAQWLSDHKETFFLFSSQEPFAYWRLTGDSNIQMGQINRQTQQQCCVLHSRGYFG